MWGSAGWGSAPWGGNEIPSATGTVPLSSSDTLSIADTATLISGAVLSSSDTLSIADTATLISGAVLSSSDTLSIADIADLTIGGVIALFATDAISIADSARLVSGAILSVTDAVSIADTATLTIPFFPWYLYQRGSIRSLVTFPMDEPEAEALRVLLGYTDKVEIVVPIQILPYYFPL